MRMRFPALIGAFLQVLAFVVPANAQQTWTIYDMPTITVPALAITVPTVVPSPCIPGFNCPVERPVLPCPGQPWCPPECEPSPYGLSCPAGTLSSDFAPFPLDAGRFTWPIVFPPSPSPCPYGFCP